MNAALPPDAVFAAHNPHGCHPEEWAARVQLAACYRIFAMMGWTEMIYNHITVRLSDRVTSGAKQFLINPFGLHYSEVTASNLVRIDLTGKIVGVSEHPVNPAGFTVHAAIHDGIDNAHCVMHTHTTSGVAVACSRAGLSMDNFYSAQMHDQVSYHPFEGITVHAEEGPRLVKNIMGKPFVILQNHGLLCYGQTLPQTFARLWTLQRACDVQMAGAALGPTIPVPDAVAAKSSRNTLQFNPQFGAGQDIFDAMTRLVDKIDNNYQS
jgi:ribulose-5-phosphate 4-epimerase/fuculose-1-phosphate aldolase